MNGKCPPDILQICNNCIHFEQLGSRGALRFFLTCLRLYFIFALTSVHPEMDLFLPPLAGLSAGLLFRRTISKPRCKPPPAIASHSGESGGLVRLVEHISLINQDVKSRYLAGLIEIPLFREKCMDISEMISCEKGDVLFCE